MHAQRVRTRAEFAALRSGGRRSRRRALQVIHRAAAEPGAAPAVAYAIGKAVGTAVVRNRVRRRLRALVDRSDLPGGTYLVIVTPAAATLGSDQLAVELAACLADIAVPAGTPAS